MLLQRIVKLPRDAAALFHGDGARFSLAHRPPLPSNLPARDEGGAQAKRRDEGHPSRGGHQAGTCPPRGTSQELHVLHEGNEVEIFSQPPGHVGAATDPFWVTYVTVPDE